jgi:hypothetical protein
LFYMKYLNFNQKKKELFAPKLFVTVKDLVVAIELH